MPVDFRFWISVAVGIALNFGCSSNDFKGIRGNRPKPPPSVSDQTAETQDRIQPDKDPSGEEDGKPATSVVVGPPVTLETDAMGVGVSADLLPAPEVEIVSVEKFNGKYFVKITCSQFAEEPTDCENSGQDFSFALSDVLIGLTTQSTKLGSELSQDLNSISEMAFSSTTPRILPDGAVEFGPLNSPKENEQLAEVVIRLNSKNQDGSLSSSYRLFTIEKATP